MKKSTRALRVMEVSTFFRILIRRAITAQSTKFFWTHHRDNNGEKINDN